MSGSNGGIRKDAERPGPDDQGILLYQPSEESTSVVDVALTLVRNMRLIGLAAVIGAFVGLVAILIPEEERYTSTATVIREGESGSRGGSPLMSLNRLGLNFGGPGTGLTAAVYPEILTSREVRYSVVRDTFRVGGVELTLVEYLNEEPDWWDRLSSKARAYTIGLPTTIQKSLRPAKSTGSAPSTPSSPDSAPPTITTEKVIRATPHEEAAMSKVRNLINTSIDSETGLMQISGTADQPQLSVDLVRSFLAHFQDRVREIQTEKARQDVQFVQERFDQAAAELAAAEEELAQFLDRNRSVQSARLITYRERLQRKVDFKASLYSELQTQFAQAELNLQSSSPVITVLEAPATPTSPAGSDPTFVFILSVLFGALAGVGLAFGRTYLQRSRQEDEHQKIVEIESILARTKLGRLFRKSGSVKSNEPTGAV